MPEQVVRWRFLIACSRRKLGCSGWNSWSGFQGVLNGCEDLDWVAAARLQCQFSVFGLRQAEPDLLNDRQRLGGVFVLGSHFASVVA
jgi:hypothetical protein